MKQFKSYNTETPDPDKCAAALMDSVPLVMRTIRSEIRNNRPPDLSVPQFRALSYVSKYMGASVSDVAQHLGLTLPSTSKMIEGLIKRDLMTRNTCPSDHRRAILSITDSGKNAFESARLKARIHISRMLAGLSEDELTEVMKTMHCLRSVFACKCER